MVHPRINRNTGLHLVHFAAFAEAEISPIRTNVGPQPRATTVTHVPPSSKSSLAMSKLKPYVGKQLGGAQLESKGSLNWLERTSKWEVSITWEPACLLRALW